MFGNLRGLSFYLRFFLRFLEFFFNLERLFKGKSAASESETQSVQNILLSKFGQWDSYLTIHSYGQFWFTPWSFTSYSPYDYNDLHEKATIATQAIHSVNGSRNNSLSAQKKINFIKYVA